MAILKVLGWQGIAGIAVALILGIALIVQKGETRHWKRQSAQFEQLYHNEQTTLAMTVGNYRAAAEAAKKADADNAARVLAEQKQINERSQNALQTRLADARSAIQRLQQHPQTAAHPGSTATAAVPSIPTPTCGADSPALDPTTRAFDCAIQLDELIKWTKGQHNINIQGNSNDNSKSAAGAAHD